ncbi:hypothetical protein PHMEG_0004490 [Phytophthora megakarya]|uniref:CCHC-type domain-containing protein n=1 Tax=Phytophthora megakarya TaxID=4795 RepID=A0A225WTQ9_9STRA|nr:hypothetical protein PHMEG_0004490 [Phytophthora megakarya]
MKQPKMKDLDRPGFPKFSGKEIYAGVGARFLAWGNKFVQHLVAAQMMNALNSKSEGPALAFFDKIYPKWTAESNTCLCDSAPEYVKKTMLTRLDSNRVDHIQQAWEQVAFAAEYVISSKRQNDGRGAGSRGGRGNPGGRGGQGGRGDKGQGFVGRVNACGARTCWSCGEKGHIKSNCPESKAKAPNGEKVTLAIGSVCVVNGLAGDRVWILDSGSSVHLVKDESLLQDAVDYRDAWSTANGGTLKVTKRGTVALRSVVNGWESQVDLMNVFYCKTITNNIISYGLLEEKGMYLTRHIDKSYVERAADERCLFETQREGTVLVIDPFGGCTERERVNAVLSAVESAQASAQGAETACTLVERHNILGHLAFDTVERMADARGSGIKLTSRERLN